MNIQSEKPKQRRKWETPAVSVLAFRDTRTKAPSLADLTAFGVHSIPSDIRLKRDVFQVSQLDNGIKLYRYRYLLSDQVYVGVMAQEVAEIAPDAVLQGEDGYLRVNYERLGLRLTTWEEWIAGGCLPFQSAATHGVRAQQALSH